MKNTKSVTIALITIIIISSIIIAYNKNWFQQTSPTIAPLTRHMSLTLEIYGNANMDDKIDEDDITYVQQIINGVIPVTQFADANKDGIIDNKDIDQISAIINSQATKLHMLDGIKRDIVVSLPANRVIAEYTQNAELVKILGIENIVVGVDSGLDPVKHILFPDNADSITSVGNFGEPNYEAILNLHPTTLLVFGPATTDYNKNKVTHLPGVDVIYLGLYTPNVTNPEDSTFLQGILKAGYIFNKVSRATEYANWLLDITSSISSKVSTIPVNQRRTVLIASNTQVNRAYVAMDTLGQACILAGGINIANAPTGSTTYYATLEPEYILSQNPRYIFIHTVKDYFGIGINEPAHEIDTKELTGMKTDLQQYVAQPAFDTLDAVKNNNIYMISGDFRNNAMGGTLGAVYMAKILYPDVFTDLNPQTVHQEYITRFLRLNYSLDTNGVYLYPPITVNGDTIGIPNEAK